MIEAWVMLERLLQLDDLRNIDSPEKIASLFKRLGYNAEAQPLDIEDLQLPSRSGFVKWFVSSMKVR